MAKLADSVGLSKGHMSNFERGFVNITVGTLIRIAGALDTTAMHILCGMGDSELEKVAEELHALPWEAQRELVAKVLRARPV